MPGWRSSRLDMRRALRPHARGDLVIVRIMRSRKSGKPTRAGESRMAHLCMAWGLRKPHARVRGVRFFVCSVFVVEASYARGRADHVTRHT